jgi:hypothetical protein
MLLHAILSNFTFSRSLLVSFFLAHSLSLCLPLYCMLCPCRTSPKDGISRLYIFGGKSQSSLLNGISHSFARTNQGIFVFVLMLSNIVFSSAFIWFGYFGDFSSCLLIGAIALHACARVCCDLLRAPDLWEYTPYAVRNATIAGAQIGGAWKLLAGGANYVGVTPPPMVPLFFTKASNGISSFVFLVMVSSIEPSCFEPVVFSWSYWNVFSCCSGSFQRSLIPRFLPCGRFSLLVSLLVPRPACITRTVPTLTHSTFGTASSRRSTRSTIRRATFGCLTCARRLSLSLLF